jgi:uncharacterized membrane protein
MGKKALILLFFTIIFVLIATHFLVIKKENNPIENISSDKNFTEQNYYRAKVEEIKKEEIEISEDFSSTIYQNIELEIISGKRKGEIIYVENNSFLDPDQAYRFKEGDKVVLASHINYEGEEFFYIAERYRINRLVFVFIIFLGIVFYFGRGKGAGALLGLVFSALILIYYIVPNIIAGNNPMVVTLVGSILIASVSLFLAHGANKRTVLIWLSTVATLILSICISYFFVEITNIFGGGSDSALAFQLGEYSYISLKGLLLAGMVVGVLGILSDVTSTQTAVIWELKKTDPSLKFKDLYTKSLNVGKEHIASLINTLVLVYAGASLPLFIVFQITKNAKLWAIITSEPIAEEIVRTLVGTTSLVLAVPISSLIASYFIDKFEVKKN